MVAVVPAQLTTMLPPELDRSDEVPDVVAGVVGGGPPPPAGGWVAVPGAVGAPGSPAAGAVTPGSLTPVATWPAAVPPVTPPAAPLVPPAWPTPSPALPGDAGRDAEPAGGLLSARYREISSLLNMSGPATTEKA